MHSETWYKDVVVKEEEALHRIVGAGGCCSVELSCSIIWTFRRSCTDTNHWLGPVS